METRWSECSGKRIFVQIFIRFINSYNRILTYNYRKSIDKWGENDL